LALPAAMLGLSMLMAWQGLWTQAEERAREASAGAAEYASRLLNAYTTTVDSLSGDVRGVSEAEIRADEPRWHRHLQRQILRLRLALDAKLIAADGSVLAAASGSPPPSANMVTREHFSALERIPEGAPWISRTYARDSDGKRFFAISRARHLPDGGAVALAIDQEAFGAGLAKVAIRSGEIIALIRRDGEILLRYPAARGVLPRLPPETPIMQAMARGEAAGSFRSNLPIDGAPTLVAFQRLAEHPTIYAVTVIPRALILQQWWREVWHVLAFGALAMLALGALAWRVARQQASLLDAKAELEARVAERSAELADEGQRLALALEADDLGIWEMDLVRGTIWRSARLRQMLGISENSETIHYPDQFSFIHPDDVPLLKESHRRVLGGEAKDFHTELRFASPSGGWGWVEAFGRVVRQDPLTGAPQLLTGITRDITARKEAEARREQMIRELDHRGKNILALIQSILRLSKKEDPARYAARVEGRIAALSRAQAQLSAEGWSGADFAALLRGELAPLVGGMAGLAATSRITLEGPALRLTAQAVQPLILALHELASNARDHGAFSVVGGHISITWRMDQAAEMLALTWEESGGPPPKAPARWSVGGTLLRSSIETQLQGSFAPAWPERGFAATITLPLGKVVQAAATG
jgi:PAS domain S-box-containing protein